MLAREKYYSVMEDQVLIEMWRKHHKEIRPHNSPGYWLPTPASIVVQLSQIQRVGLTLRVVQVLVTG